MSKIHCTTDGQVATLTLDNAAKLNALTPDMLVQLDACCDELEGNSSVRTVLLTGAGQKAFCVGADISAWADLDPAMFARHWVRKGHRVFDRLARLAKPTIAVLNGHAFGGGLELAACCDIRVISTSARLGLPEAQVGIVPGWGGSQRVARLLPEPVVKEMMLFGRQLTSDRALELGFVAEVGDDPVALAREIAAKQGTLSPRSVEVAKYMLHAGMDEDRAALIEALGSGFAAGSNDKQEGVQAFAQKRKPEFSGH